MRSNPLFDSEEISKVTASTNSGWSPELNESTNVNKNPTFPIPNSESTETEPFDIQTTENETFPSKKTNQNEIKPSIAKQESSTMINLNSNLELDIETEPNIHQNQRSSSPNSKSLTSESFSYSPYQPKSVFKGLTIFVKGNSLAETTKYRDLIQSNGGTCVLEESPAVQFIVTSNFHFTPTKFLDLVPPILKFEWIDDSIKEGKIVDLGKYIYPTLKPILSMKDLIIAITGFVGEERKQIILQIKNCGAKYTDKFSRTNTHLICDKPQGEKYVRACEWNSAHIVTVNWLIDCIKKGDRLPESDYSLVFSSHLQSYQEQGEQPVQEMEIEENISQMIVGDNMSELDELIRNSSPRGPIMTGVVVHFSKKISMIRLNRFMELLTSMNGAYSYILDKAVTHYVCEGKPENNKALKNRKISLKIVSPVWLIKCFICKQLLPEQDYPSTMNPKMNLDISGIPASGITLKRSRPVTPIDDTTITSKKRKIAITPTNIISRSIKKTPTSEKLLTSSSATRNSNLSSSSFTPSQKSITIKSSSNSVKSNQNSLFYLHSVPLPPEDIPLTKRLEERRKKQIVVASSQDNVSSNSNYSSSSLIESNNSSLPKIKHLEIDEENQILKLSSATNSLQEQITKELELEQEKLNELVKKNNSSLNLDPSIEEDINHEEIELTLTRSKDLMDISHQESIDANFRTSSSIAIVSNQSFEEDSSTMEKIQNFITLLDSKIPPLSSNHTFSPHYHIGLQKKKSNSKKIPRYMTRIPIEQSSPIKQTSPKRNSDDELEASKLKGDGEEEPQFHNSQVAVYVKKIEQNERNKLKQQLKKSHLRDAGKMESIQEELKLFSNVLENTENSGFTQPLTVVNSKWSSPKQNSLQPPQHQSVISPLSPMNNLSPQFTSTLSHQSSSNETNGNYYFLISGFTPEEHEIHTQRIRNLKGIICESCSPQVTHVIAHAISRNSKCLSACVSGGWILKPSFLEVSEAAGHFVNEQAHQWSPEECTKESIRLVADAAIKCRCEVERRRKEKNDPTIGLFSGFTAILKLDETFRKVWETIFETGGGVLVPDTNLLEEAFLKEKKVTHIFVDSKISSEILAKTDFVQTCTKLGILLLESSFLRQYIFAVGNLDSRPFDLILGTKLGKKKQKNSREKEKK